jgi:PST family polysaccharide transporter
MLSLGVLQGSSYLFPLLTLPYLTRVLGLETYGILVFAQAVLFYAVLVTDYGFHLSATRTLSLRLGRGESISDVVSTVFAAKLILAASSLGIIASLSFLLPSLEPHRMHLMAASSLVAGSLLFPQWFYQGIQRMKWVAAMTLIGRAVFLILLFVMVDGPEDVTSAIFLQSGSGMLTGLISLFMMKRLQSFEWILPTWNGILQQLRDGWFVFLSQISTTFFLNTNILFLNHFATLDAVGRYGVAERLIKALVGLSIPISTSIYPHVTQLFDSSRTAAMAFLRKTAIYGSLLMGGVSIATFIWAEQITWLATGSTELRVALLLRILSILPLSVFLDNLFGTQILLGTGHDKQMMRSLIRTSVVAITVGLLFIPPFGDVGAALAFLIAEIVLLALFIRECARIGLLPWRS